jgi:multidrug efflux pump subunit AcrA (membrane-fusion protein)
MSDRIRGLIFGVLLLAAAAGVFALLKSRKVEPKPLVTNFVKSVYTREVKNGDVAFEIPVTGRLEAVDRIELFAEVQGVLRGQSADFREGTAYRAGATLVDMDDAEAQATTLAQRSTYLNTLTQVLPDLKLDYPEAYPAWETYLQSINPEQFTPAPPTTENKKLKLFLTARGVYSTYYSLKSAETRLQKYRIRAPFDGVLTQALVSPGTLVRPGQKLGEFLGNGAFEMEASVALADLNNLKPGQKVALFSNDVKGEWSGTIVRINQRVDPTTQSVSLYIRTAGSGLREGMYLNARLGNLTLPNAFEIDRKILVGNNQLYLVATDSTLQRVAVEVLRVTRESAIVSGLPEGALLMNENFPGASAGLKVTPLKPAP